MTAERRRFDADDVRVGHTYAIALAPCVITTATVVFERLTGTTRSVRFTSPALKLPGYSTAERFADMVRAARGE